jgi:hypothetical protein
MPQQKLLTLALARMTVILAKHPNARANATYLGACTYDFHSR